MENLTAVDGGAALIIILSAILAFSRGLVRELMAILGWIGAAVAAYYFAPGVQPLVKELPMEYAIEMNRLIQLQMEGSIG